MATYYGTLMTTTIETITDEQIKQLRNEAGTAGDRKQVELCDRALQGDGAARRKCADVIAYAEGEAQA